MNLFKKTCGFLTVLALLLTLNTSFVYADGEEEAEETPVCSADNLNACICSGDNCCDAMGGSGFYLDDAVYQHMLNNGDVGAYVVTELKEPISGLNDVITSGNINTSRVFLKYKCQTYVTKEWNYETKQPEQVYHISKSGAWQYAPADTSPSCPEGATCTYVQLLVGQSGTGLLKTYIAIIYRWAASIVGIIAMLVIVVSGIQISMDQGSGEQVGEAKNRIMQSLAGLVILFLSALILYTINPTFFTK